MPKSKEITLYKTLTTISKMSYHLQTSAKLKYSPDLAGQQHKLQFSAPCRRVMSLRKEKPSLTFSPGSLSFLLELKLNWSKKLQLWDKWPSSFRNIHPPGIIPPAWIFIWMGFTLFSLNWGVSQGSCLRLPVYAEKRCMFISPLLCLKFTLAHSPECVHVTSKD